jgi:hypothetical protein
MMHGIGDMNLVYVNTMLQCDNDIELVELIPFIPRIVAVEVGSDRK